MQKSILNKRFIFFCIKAILIVTVISVLCYIISPIFVPKWDTADDNFVGTNLKGLNVEQENTLDVFYVGNSSVFCGISPIEIWDKYGLTGYNIAIGSSRTWTEYYMIKNYLQNQSPKMIVLDISCAFEQDDAEEVYYRKAFDHIKMSSEKIEAILSDAYDNSIPDVLSYIMPVIRFHDRWQELSSKDFNMAYKDDMTISKGYDYYDNVVPYNNSYNYLNDKVPDTISDKSKQYLDKIVDLCKKNDIEVIFTVVPTTESWNNNMHNVMQEYCNKNNVEFFDLNTEKQLKAMKLDWTKDTCDGGIHLNHSGAYKVSMAIGDYISKKLNHITHNSEVTKQWNNCYSRYIDEIVNEKA